MKPTLNSADIKLLKGIFATKDDLKSFATKDDLKSFATKDDLKSFATKDDLKSGLGLLWQKVESRFEELEEILAKSFLGIERRLGVVENELGIPPTN